MTDEQITLPSPYKTLMERTDESGVWEQRRVALYTADQARAAVLADRAARAAAPAICETKSPELQDGSYWHAAPAEQKAEPFPPHPQCTTKSECRNAGFCMDQWLCGSPQPGTEKVAEQKAEPVAWMDEFGNVKPIKEPSAPVLLGNMRYPLYTRPLDPAEVLRLADEYASACVTYEKLAIAEASEQALDVAGDAHAAARAALEAYVKGKAEPTALEAVMRKAFKIVDSVPRGTEP